MNFTPAITSIFLVSFSTTLTRFSCLFDKKLQQDILAYIIYTFVTKESGLIMLTEPTLDNIRAVLTSLYNQLHSDTPKIKDSYNPHLRQLIGCFFVHLYMHKMIWSEFGSPTLFKVNDRIFLHFPIDISLPSEVFSLLTSTQYPDLFLTLKQTNSKFLEFMIHNSDGTSSLLLPEFPYPLNRRIYKLYDHLVKTFSTLESEFKEYEKDEIQALWVNLIREYLIEMRNFFDVKQ